MAITKDMIIEAIDRHKSAMDFDVKSADPEMSLVDMGIIDSLSYVNVILELSSGEGVEVDIAEMDPEEVTSVAGLFRFFADQ